MQKTLFTFVLIVTSSFARAESNACENEAGQIEKWGVATAQHWAAFHNRINNGVEPTLDQVESSLRDFQADQVALSRINPKNADLVEAKKSFGVFVRDLIEAGQIVRDVTRERRAPNATEANKAQALQTTAVAGGQAAEKSLKKYMQAFCSNGVSVVAPPKGGKPK